MIFEKWDRNAEKRLVFGVPHSILAIFKPVVGDFYEHFSNQGFFRQSRWAGMAQNKREKDHMRKSEFQGNRYPGLTWVILCILGWETIVLIAGSIG